MRKYIYSLVLAVVLGLIVWSLMIAYGLMPMNPIVVLSTAGSAVLGWFFGQSLADMISTKYGHKETVGTMKIFFIFMGLMGISALYNSANQSIQLTPLGLINLVVGLVYVYIGLELGNLLKKHTAYILALIYAQLVVYAMTLLYSIVITPNFFLTAVYIGGILLNLWVITGIHNLSGKTRKA